MKIHFYIFVLFALFTSCNNSSEYTITGTVDKKALNGKYVYMYPYGVKTNTPIDSAYIENQKFTFKGVQDIPVLRVLEFDIYDVAPRRPVIGQNSPYNPVFVLEKGNLFADLSEMPTVTGTPENDAWTILQKEIKKFHSNEESEIEIVSKYIKSNPGKISAGKLFCDYLYSLDEPFAFNTIKKANETFKSAPGIEGAIAYLDKIEKVTIGKHFTDFEMSDTTGVTHKLSEYVGKENVILLDFWASWCGPCIEEMPNLQKTYDRFKDKGFEIVGISFDSRNDDWKNAIEKYNLNWLHLSDLKKWDNLASKLYTINYIPFTILIDKEGTIIAKNLKGEVLDQKLAEILK